MTSSGEPRQVFVHDLGAGGYGARFTVAGWIESHRKLRDGVAVQLRDATGTVWASVPRGSVVSKGKRIRVTGLLRESPRNANGFALECDECPVAVTDLDTPYGEIDAHMQEQAARVLLTRTIRILSDAMENSNFTCFDSKVISTSLSSHGLEGMQVVYPGFGSPVALVTSPASQIREFLLVTGQSRAFTVGTSFSTSFRLPKAGNEARVVMGLALDMSDHDHEELLRDLVQKVLEAIGQTGEGGDEQSALMLRTVVRDPKDALAPDGMSPARLHRWVQIVVGHTLIAEGAIESLGAHGRLGSLTFYPGQVLGLLARTPTRRLMNLGETHAWKS